MRCIALASSLALWLAVAACGGSKPSPTPPAPDTTDPQPAAPCLKTGCSGTVCADEEMMSTCEYKPEYACYQKATCERQPDGACGWTENAELEACLANPPPM